jgi:hypothetical protein
MPDVVQFGLKAAERIRAATLRVERTPYAGDDKSRPATLWNMGVIEGVVTTAITPFNSSASTYGQGYVQPYIDTFNSNTNSYAAGADPAFPSPVLTLNWFANSGTVAVNTHVQIAWRNGNWRYAGGDCNTNG